MKITGIDVMALEKDMGNCGGITEAKKICDMAHIFDVGVQMHVCSGSSRHRPGHIA